MAQAVQQERDSIAEFDDDASDDKVQRCWRTEAVYEERVTGDPDPDELQLSVRQPVWKCVIDYGAPTLTGALLGVQRSATSSRARK